MSLPESLLRAVGAAISDRYGHSTLVGRAYDISEPKSLSELVERTAKDWLAVTHNLSVHELDNLLWYLEDPDSKESD